MIKETETIKDLDLKEVMKEYDNLFDLVPCLITVHDRDYRIIKYNKEFKDKFAPEPGTFCYEAYKDRKRKCENCPVEKTFKDGTSHYSEEKGVNKNNSTTYWIAKTAPIKNSKGEIVAAVEMNLDITPSKQLEEQLKQSEERYFSIFNNIPNPLFVLDYETLVIIDCNISATAAYQYTRDNLIGRSFLDLFNADEREIFFTKIRSLSFIDKVKQATKQGRNIYVDMWISAYKYPEKKVLLVASTDITRRLETEQQLIQASKMATLGVMASGVAHELNQPLSVIKTASGFLLKKTKKAGTN
ncbi:MAG: PAS domain S-box protein [Deltaproteobacteria bacterium]|nr:PAS domain S-box protein [Deltaproteobacteria bacterium]